MTINSPYFKTREYLGNKPFPHIIVDDFFDEGWLNQILDEFPKTEKDYKTWDIRDDKGIQVKLRSNWKSSLEIPYQTRELFNCLNHRDTLEMLSNLTGINGLIPDMYYDAGGMNEIKRGGQLAIHCDGNKNQRMGVYRALNLIIYLNKNWKPEYGGNLNFYDKDLNVVKSIEPLFNRMVIFTTNENSLHGHPEPLNCPENMSRKSLILYYYTRDNIFNNDSEKDIPHSAQFLPIK